jgi:hypothetical protein
MCKNMGRAWTVSVGVSRHLFVLNCGSTGSKALKNLILAGTDAAVDGLHLALTLDLFST